MQRWSAIQRETKEEIKSRQTERQNNRSENATAGSSSQTITCAVWNEVYYDWVWEMAETGEAVEEQEVLWRNETAVIRVRDRHSRVGTMRHTPMTGCAMVPVA